MIKGYLSSNNEPCIPIHLRGSNRLKTVPAIIDTGFNGYLAVPKQIIVNHHWELIGSEKYEVATGQLETFDVYLGEIRWNKKWLLVYALVTNSKDILIGTKLLKDSILTINFRSKKLHIKT